MKKAVIMTLTVLLVLMSALPASAIDPTKIEVYVGETYEISCDKAEGVEGVEWKSSDETVAEIVGAIDRTRAVHTLKTGTATISVCQSDGTVIQSSTLTVVEKPTFTPSSAVFKQNGGMKYIDRNILGEHMSTNNQVSEGQKFVEDNVKFGSVRVAYNPADSVTDFEADVKKFLEPFKRNDMTVVVILSRFKSTDTVETLEKQAKAVYDVLNGYQSDVYFEFGNEMYGYCTTDELMDEYLEKCKALYPLIKKFGNNVHAAVPVYGDLQDGLAYDLKIKSISNYFDAVVPHLYTALWKYDGLTDSAYVRRIFTSNRNCTRSIEIIKGRFPGKDLWVTEYGHMDYMMHLATTSEEKARLQNSKTVAAALGNIDKFLEYLVDDDIKFAHYHTPNDSQGFGMVQGTVKLQNFYPFAEISAIMDECDTVSLLDADGRTELKKELVTIKGAPPILSQEGYLFGVGNKVRYAVFINRDNRECEVSLTGHELKKTWEYTSDYPAGETYLRGTGKFTDVPKKVETPTVYNNTEFADSVTLAPCSMTVCRVPFEDYSINVYKKVGQYEIPLTYAENGDTVIKLSSELIGDTEAVLAEYDADFKTLKSASKLTVGTKNTISFNGGSAYKVILLNNFKDITPLCESYVLKAVSGSESVTSPMNGMHGVPTDKAVPLSVTGASLTKDDVTVIGSNGEILTDFSLVGGDGEYTLKFEQALKAAAAYTVYTPFGNIEFVTEYDTSTYQPRPTVANPTAKVVTFSDSYSEISLEINIMDDPTGNTSVSLSDPNDTVHNPSLSFIFNKPDANGKRSLQARYSDSQYANGVWNVEGDNGVVYWEIGDAVNITLSDYTVYFHVYDSNGVHKASYSRDLLKLVQGDRIKTNNIKFSKYSAGSVYYRTDIGFGDK